MRAETPEGVVTTGARMCGEVVIELRFGSDVREVGELPSRPGDRDSWNKQRLEYTLHLQFDIHLT